MRKSITYLFSTLMVCVLFAGTDSSSNLNNDILQAIQKFDSNGSDEIISGSLKSIVQRVLDFLGENDLIVCLTELNGRYHWKDDKYNVDLQVVLDHFRASKFRGGRVNKLKYKSKNRELEIKLHFDSVDVLVNYKSDGISFGQKQNIQGTMRGKATGIDATVKLMYTIKSDGGIEITELYVDYDLNDITSKWSDFTDPAVTKRVNEFTNYYFDEKKDRLIPEIQQKVKTKLNDYLKNVKIGNLLPSAIQYINNHIVTDHNKC